MKRSMYLFILFLFMVVSCTQNRRLKGEYRRVDSFMPYIIHLNSDRTGYYTWWTDIQMKKNGTWTISNDTLLFFDESSPAVNGPFFVIKDNQLMDKAGRVYVRLSASERHKVYRGR